MESILGEAWVMIQANIEPALKQVSAFMEKVASTEAIITTRADTAQVVRSYDAVRTMARDLMPVITLGVDGAPAVRGIDAVETMVREAHPTMVVSADTAPALRQVSALRAEMSASTIGAVGGGAVARRAPAAEGEAAAGGALGGMFGGLGSFAAVLGVLEGVHGIASAAKDTQEFQTRMVDLSTGAGEATKNLGMVAKGLLQMSTDVGVSAINLQKGLYFIESDGIHGADALNVLKAAAEGSRTGLADMEDVTTGLMTVMRSYEIPASQAAKTTSALVEAVAHGGVRLTDFAQGMKTVSPIAAAFNIPMSQVLGAMSTMTSVTHNATQSATGLRYLLNTMAAPSNTASAALDSIGIHGEALQRTLHDQGLVGALKLIELHLGQTFPGDAVKANAVLHDLFGGTRGMTAGLELTNAHLVEMIGNIGDITAKTDEAGNSVAGWSQMQKTLGYQVDVIRASLVRFGIEAGTVVLPGVTLLLRGIIGLAEGIGKTLGAAISLVRPEWDAFAKGLSATPGENLGGGLLGWIGRVGERVHGLAADVRSTWNGVIGALSGKTPTGTPQGGFLGHVAGAVGDFTGALRGKPALSAQPGPDGTFAVMPKPTTGLAGMATSAGSTLRSVGKNVYPAMTLFSAGFSGKLDSSGILGWQGTVVHAGEIAKRAFGDVKKAIGDMVGAVKVAVDWGGKHKKLLADVAIGIGLVAGAVGVWTIAQAALDAVMAANPVGLIVIAIGSLVGGLIYAYQKVGWFREGLQAAFGFIEKVGKEVWSILSEAIHGFIDGPLAFVKDQVGAFSDFWNRNSESIKLIWRILWTAIKTEFEIYWALFSAAFHIALDTLAIIWRTAWDLIRDDFRLVWGVIGDILTFFLDLIKNTVNLFIDLFTGKWGKLWGDVKALVGDAFGDIVKTFSDFGKNGLSLLYDVGKDIIGGLIHGLTDAGKTVWNTVKDIAGSIVDGVKHFFGIKSPSTVMAGLGGNIIKGLIKGILAQGAGMGGILDQIFAGALENPWGWLEHHLAALGGILDKVPGLATGLAGKAASGALHGLEGLGSSLFDAGGILPPGASLAINKTGAGEPVGVFTPAQWSAVQALASGQAGGGTTIVHNTVYLGDREIKDILREEATTVVDGRNDALSRTLRGGVKRR